MLRMVLIGFICLLTACGGQQTTKPNIPNEPSGQGTTSSEEVSPKNESDQAVKSAEKNHPETTNGTKPGGYYLDDGPDANPPTNLDEIPDAVPKHEPLDPNKNKPYQALGETYKPMTSAKSFTQSGIASWYGKRFHGKKTANGEKYDMYAMTAAHPTLPLPSYVKVVNPSNNRSVIVRVNDRGPFKHSRIIDLSYAAAHKLRIVERGSAPVHIEAVDVDTYLTANKNASPVPKLESVDKSPTESTNNKSALQQFFVQVGAFKLEENANKLKLKIQNLGIASKSNINHVYNSNLHRLKLGPYNNKTQAGQIAAEIRRKLNISSVIHTQ
jgi:rare lipoprotein A